MGPEDEEYEGWPLSLILEDILVRDPPAMLSRLALLDIRHVRDLLVLPEHQLHELDMFSPKEIKALITALADTREQLDALQSNSDLLALRAFVLRVLGDPARVRPWIRVLRANKVLNVEQLLAQPCEKITKWSSAKPGIKPAHCALMCAEIVRARDGKATAIASQ